MPLPIDESGFTLSTLHDFEGSGFTPGIAFGITFGISLDGRYLYMAKGSSAHITRIDTSDWSSAVWAGVNARNGIVTDRHGNVYALGFTIAMITPDGDITDPWTSLPAGWTALSMGYGRDGAIYVVAHDGATYTVFRITGGVL